MKKQHLLMAIIALSLLGVTQAQAQTVRFVDATATGMNDGTSWINAYTSLSFALSEVDNVGIDELWVRGLGASNPYLPGPARSDSFVIPPNVEVYGGFAGTAWGCG